MAEKTNERILKLLGGVGGYILSRLKKIGAGMSVNNVTEKQMNGYLWKGRK